MEREILVASFLDEIAAPTTVAFKRNPRDGRDFD